MCESLRNDGRVWVPKKKGDDARAPDQIPESRARLLPRAEVSRASATWRRATSRRARPRKCATKAAASARAACGVYLDFADAIKRLGEQTIRERYGNLFEMYERITDENPYRGADADLPRRALHDGRALGGLQPHEHDPRACT